MILDGCILVGKPAFLAKFTELYVIYVDLHIGAHPKVNRSGIFSRPCMQTVNYFILNVNFDLVVSFCSFYNFFNFYSSVRKFSIIYTLFLYLFQQR